MSMPTIPEMLILLAILVACIGGMVFIVKVFIYYAKDICPKCTSNNYKKIGKDKKRCRDCGHEWGDEDQKSIKDLLKEM